MENKKLSCNIAFVILQYGNEKDTEKCINSIEQKLQETKYRIVVVDNCSKDTAAEDIRSFCAKKSYVEIVENENNLGFACGNNIGIEYVRKKYSPDFVAVINNDTELLSEALYERLESDYNKYNFAVWGPMVLSGDGKYTSNPMALQLFDEQEIDREIKHSKRMILISRLHLLEIYNCLKKKKSKTESCPVDNRFNYLQDVKLHGCFLVFSPKYFEYFSGFDPSTFLYMEEDILQLRLKKNALKSLYCPRYLIFHKEGAASQSLIRNNCKRMEFIFRNRLKSQKIYKKILLGEK